MNLNVTQAADTLSGLEDLGVVDVNGTVIGSHVLPAPGNTSDFDINIPFSRNDLISIIRYNVTGLAAPIGSFWYPVNGSSVFQDITDSLIVIVTVKSATNGRNLHVRFYNNTVGASVTVPTTTWKIHAHLYQYPF